MAVVRSEDVGIFVPKQPGRSPRRGVQALGREHAYPSEIIRSLAVVGVGLGPKPGAFSPVDTAADKDAAPRPGRVYFHLKLPPDDPKLRPAKGLGQNELFIAKADGVSPSAFDVILYMQNQGG